MAVIKLRKVESLDYRKLKGFEKAAILVNYLGPDAAKVFFKNVDEADLKKLLSTMGRLRIVPIEVTKKVLEEFYELISESEDYIFSEKVTSKPLAKTKPAVSLHTWTPQAVRRVLSRAWSLLIPKPSLIS